jgi:uncharacterized protein
MFGTKLRREAIAFVAILSLLFWFLEPLDGLVLSLFSLEQGSRLADAVGFFAFEAPKVLLLLFLVVFGIGIVRSYFSPERTRRLLSRRSPLVGNVMASTLGIVTPFCSCSAVPLFIGFVEAGVPLGATLSFLVAAPMINEVAAVLLFGLFGWKTALIYVITGLVIAITAGFILGKMKMERFVEEWVYSVKGPGSMEDGKLDFDGRIKYGFTAVRDIVGRVWPYVLAGIAVGAAIHGYVPQNLMSGIMGKSAWWAVPAAVLIGVPLYSNAAGIIPIVQALIEKGASLGTALAFMMSVIGLSFPETVILRKVLKLRLIVVFVGVVAAGIITVGYLFNFIY